MNPFDLNKNGKLDAFDICMLNDIFEENDNQYSDEEDENLDLDDEESEDH